MGWDTNVAVLTKIPLKLNNLYLEIKIKDLIIQCRQNGGTKCSLQVWGWGSKYVAIVQTAARNSYLNKVSFQNPKLSEEMEYKQDRLK